MSSIEKKMNESIEELHNMQADQIKKTVSDLMTKVFEQGMSFKDAVGISDESMESIYGHAYRSYNSGNYDEGRELFRVLTMLNPLEPKYLLGVAACNHMLKDYEKAIESYVSCTLMNADDPLPYYYASDCCLKINDISSALIFLQIVVDLAKDKKEYAIIKDRAQLTIDGLSAQIKEKK